MSCADIKKQLTDYIDGSLGEDMNTLVKEHLSSCSSCRKDLDDIKKTISMVHNLQEVEPPSWYTQKIMSQIRQETQKQGFLDKMKDFFTVRVQVSVYASVIMILMAVFLYRVIIPEHDHLAKDTGSPAADVANHNGSSAMKKHIVADSKGTTQDNLKDKYKPDQKGQQEISGDVNPNALVSAKSHKGKPGLIADKSTGADQQKPVSSAKPDGDVIIPKDQNLVMTGAAIKESAPGRPKPVELTLGVSDLAASSEEVETILKKVNAKITSYESLEKREILNVELDQGSYNDLLDKLRKVGDIKSRNAPAGQAAGTMNIRLEITNIR